MTPSELWDWNECSQAAAEECTRVTIPTELSLYPSSELWMQNEQQKQQLYQWSLGISARASEKKGVESRNWGVGGDLSVLLCSVWALASKTHSSLCGLLQRAQWQARDRKPRTLATCH